MNNKNKIIIILTIVLSLLTAFSGVSFAQALDVQGHWAEKQISDWLIKGLAKGYRDGTFKPDSSITRAEFVTLANNAFGYTVVKEINYSDVSSSDWFAKEIAKAAGTGYLSGYGDGTIRPEARVSRQEVASMLARILKLGTAANSNAASKFNDAKIISEWSRGAVGAITAAGYMLGYPDGTFQPEKEITRAEAVVALNKARATLVEASENSITYDKSGVFGPASGNETVKGNISITAAGVTLRNVTITGDLLLGESIGDGEVTLSNVTVQGQTIIKGGGPNSVTLDNCTLPSIVVDKEGVRVVASGNTRVNFIRLDSGAVLVEVNATGPGFESVTLSEIIPADAAVKLEGDFTNVNVNAEKAKFEVAGGTIANLEVAKEAAGASIDIAQNAKVTTMTLNAAVSVTGKGSIETAKVNVSGSKFEQKPNTVDKADNVSVDIGNTGTGKGDGNGNNPLNFEGAYLVSDGKAIGSTNVPKNPEIKLVFDRGVVRDYWDNNKNCISMESQSGSVAISVSPGNANDDTDKHNIYVTPQNNLTQGATYSIVISASLRANNGNTLGSEKTVTFTVASVSGGNGGDSDDSPVAPTYVNAVTNNQGNKIKLTFSKSMADPTGKQGEFSVNVNASVNPVTEAKLDNSDNACINLSLTNLVTYGDIITVAYNKGTVKSADGGILDTFMPQTVTNTLTDQSSVVEFVYATTNNDGTKIMVTFSKAMADPAGKHGDFTVMVEGVPDPVTAAALNNDDSNTIDLTLNTSVTGTNTVTVAYKKGSVAATDGTVLKTFAARPVTNTLTASGPLILDIEVTSKGDVSITFDKEISIPPVDLMPGACAQFTIKFDGETDTVTSIETTSTAGKIKLVLATEIKAGQAVTVEYKKGDYDVQLKTVDGGVMDDFSPDDYNVTNKSTVS